MVHYRVPLFELMSQLCASFGIDLEIFYGQPSQLELKRGDIAELPAGIRTRTRYAVTCRESRIQLICHISLAIL